MNILLVYPAYPTTFWSFTHALKFISKKATYPPLGILTVAAMLPPSWSQRLIDLNIDPLADADLQWADYVFLSAMSIQTSSVREIIRRCKEASTPIVAGGPLFSSDPQAFSDVDYLVLDEAEITLPEFLQDIANGTPQHMYRTDRWADLATSPVPRWDLIKKKLYGSMNLQYSRGCPYDCEFCDITILYGRKPRTKSARQVLRELDSLYALGWHGGVFFVDDNFIGNKSLLKKEILPAIIEWMKIHHAPFSFSTEASINLADDDELVSLMVKAGFDAVFIGIETPNEASLAECNKKQNRNRDMAANIKKLHKAGLVVQGGFIVGFDSDPESIFDQVIDFIRETKIITAMVGLLVAPHGTRLYKRLLSEGRILSAMTGDNTDFSTNIIPAMNLQTLTDGYRMILQALYTPKHYYARVKEFLKEYSVGSTNRRRIDLQYVLAFGRSIWRLGVLGKERFYYWRLLIWTILNRPRLFPLAVTFSIYGLHFRKIIESFPIQG
jgi:radical SAM superfamily enzyme YgiQ (UPF0313 family)